MALSSDPFSIVPPDHDQVEMTLARGAALREFVALEGEMVKVFAFLSGKPPASISAEFFNLNSQQRLSKLRELISSRPDLNVEVFFNTLLDDIDSLTKIRNFIVHARQIVGAEEINLANGRRRKWSARLIPPDYFDSLTSLKMNSTVDVVGAVRRFSYVSACLNELHHYFVMRTLDNSVQTPSHYCEKHERLPKPLHRNYRHYAFEHYQPKNADTTTQK
jgi:hypothetical protein